MINIASHAAQELSNRTFSVSAANLSSHIDLEKVGTVILTVNIVSLSDGASLGITNKVFQNGKEILSSVSILNKIGKSVLGLWGGKSNLTRAFAVDVSVNGAVRFDYSLDLVEKGEDIK
jgi:hypothetical protein